MSASLGHTNPPPSVILPARTEPHIQKARFLRSAPQRFALLCITGNGRKTLSKDDYSKTLVSACVSWFVRRKPAVGGGVGGLVVAVADPREGKSPRERRGSKKWIGITGDQAFGGDYALR